MDVPVDGRSRVLPDFLIVGAPRSATSSLYGALEESPGVFMSRVKEPMFFYAWDRPPIFIDAALRKPGDFFILKPEAYFRLFEAARPGDMVGEASTWYLRDFERSIPNIRRLYGPETRSVKIIMVLRNPIDRAWSHYWLKKAHGEEILPFEEAIRSDIVAERLSQNVSPAFDYLGQGLYAPSVRAFRENFDRVKIFLFEDVQQRPEATAADLAEFLGLPRTAALPVLKRWNASGVPRGGATAWAARKVFLPNAFKAVLKPFLPFHFRQNLKYRAASRLFIQPKMAPGLRRSLRPFFEDDIRRLGTLLGRDLGAWLRDPVSVDAPE
jgi:hypothetical protein